MDAELERLIDHLDSLGLNFFAKIEEFKELESDAANLVLGGKGDAVLAKALESLLSFEAGLNRLREVKVPILGGREKKKFKEGLVKHGAENLFQMKRAWGDLDKSYTEGAMIYLNFGPPKFPLSDKSGIEQTEETARPDIQVIDAQPTSQSNQYEDRTVLEFRDEFLEVIQNEFQRGEELFGRIFEVEIDDIYAVGLYRAVICISQALYNRFGRVSSIDWFPGLAKEIYDRFLADSNHHSIEGMTAEKWMEFVKEGKASYSKVIVDYLASREVDVDDLINNFEHRLDLMDAICEIVFSDANVGELDYTFGDTVGGLSVTELLEAKLYVCELIDNLEREIVERAL